jgi:hypothetical protein
MPNVVTGLAPTADLTQLERALTVAGLSLEPLQLVEPDTGSIPAATVVADSEIILGTSGTGTGVPGLTTSPDRPRLEPLAEGHMQRLLERLEALEIPDDEIDNYLDALEAGRAVVGYSAAPGTIAAVADVFAASGLAKIKTF